MRTPEQEERFQKERATVIGGSDVGAMFNLGYGCRRRLVYDKRAVPPDYPHEVTGPMKRGVYLEPVMRQLCCETTGLPVSTVEFRRHRSEEHLGAHIDGLVNLTGSKIAKGPGVLEGKVMGRQNFAKLKKEGMQEEHILQLQAGIAVWGTSWGLFAALCADPWEFVQFEIPANLALQARVVEGVSVVWREIEHGPLPDALDPKDARCQGCPWRKTCQGERLAKSAETNGTRYVRDDSLTPLIRECVELAEMADEAVALKEAARDRLKIVIGARQGILAQGYRASYPEFEKTTRDSKALEAEEKRNPAFAALMARYNTTKLERALRIYGTGD